MPSERCSRCAINWPVGTKECAQCLGPLDHFSITSSITQAEAKSITSYATFDREYERRERGLRSKCGPRKLTAAAKERMKLRDDRSEELLVAGLEINRLERVWRATKRKERDAWERENC